jgi:CRISPR/Cas system-associated protein endoribonuclease Cas2
MGGNHRSGPSSSGKAPGPKGKSASNKYRASTNDSGYTMEQMVFYKAMRNQLEAKRKAVAAAKDEGMLSILILSSCFGS